MRTIHHILNLLVMVALAGCLAGPHAVAPTQQPEAQYWPTKAWRSATPEAQGMDSAILAQMFEAIQKDDVRLHSLLIVRNGYLVTEAYWHPYGPNDKHSIESNTKSIVGALIGIAIDQGRLQGVDQKLVDFFLIV